MAQKDNHRLLVEKLDQFIRKYYINQLIRGALYSTGSIMLLFLLFSGLEHYFYFSIPIRTVLLYSFAGISLLALGFWVFKPLLNYFRLGKIISHQQAAEIIGSHFSDVKDKLLNVLQLRDQMNTATHRDLILASINQKTEDIKLVPFQSAINLGQNRKYLRYALPPLTVLLILLLAAPSFRDSSSRLINNNKAFERPAPFSFVLTQNDLTVVQFEDFDLTVEVEGPQLPNEVFIDIDNYQYRLSKEAANRFTYRFSNVQRNTPFSLYSSGVVSNSYELKVLKKPDILDFEVKLDYPGYTGRRDESLSSIGDLSVPQGTRIEWDFHALNTDSIALRFNNGAEREAAERSGEERFNFTRQAMRDAAYKVYLSNSDLPNADSILYNISVIPDLHPKIEVEAFQDTLDEKLLFLVGEASDDYGLRRLLFHYRLNPEKGEEGTLQSAVLQEPESKQTQFDHTFDIRELDLKPGDEVVYYFEVFDNDAINGSKSSRTRLMTYNMPTVKEFREKAEQNDEKVKDNLEKAISESQQIQEEMKRMREKLLQENDMDWQSREELEKLLNRQKELQQQFQDAKESFEENLKNQEEFTEMDEEMLEKQMQLQKLFEEVMSEEMRDLMEKIEEMLQELEKDDALKMMEEFQFNDEELEKEMDRLLELFKQLEMEQAMKEMVEQLEELAEEQEELSEATEELTDDDEAPLEEEDSLNSEEDVQEDNEAAESENEVDSDEQSQEDPADAENENQEENAQNNEGTQEEQNNADQQQNEQQGEQQQEGDQQQQEGDQQQQGEQQPQSMQDVQEQQQDINESFQDLQEQMEQMQEKNQELQRPKDMDEQQQQMEDIQQDLNNIQQQLQQQQKNKASQSQKNAAQKMQQMAQSMAMQMQAQEMEQMQEDMQALRQLLENLVGLSFDQEELMESLSQTNINTPKYTELVQQQFKLEDDFGLVEDSLQALAKRVFQIESFITEKVTEIKGNMRGSLDDLEERRKLQASDHQQRSMKNINDLALMLSEVMGQMQQQMAAMMSGSQMCTNPGQQGQEGQQPQDRISQGQEKLNEQMKQMKEAMEQGRGGTSKEFAEMAAKQAALRKKLREQQEKLREQGQGDKELQRMIDEMDRVETELVNKQLTNEMIKRQQEILTRLLEHENAERQRKFDEQRKSETASQQERKMPPSLEEYIKKRKAEVEMYKTVSPALKPYYKGLVEDYFKSLQSAE